MTFDQILVAIYFGGILPVAFGVSVLMRVDAKKKNSRYSWDGGPPTLIFGLIWPPLIVALIVWGLVEFFSRAADFTAEKIAGQEETPETLLRASKEPK